MTTSTVKHTVKSGQAEARPLADNSLYELHKEVINLMNSLGICLMPSESDQGCHASPQNS